MTKEEQKKIESILKDLNILDNDLTERISGLRKVVGGQAERHAFCFYRKQLWDAKDELSKLL